MLSLNINNYFDMVKTLLLHPRCRIMGTNSGKVSHYKRHNLYFCLIDVFWSKYQTKIHVKGKTWCQGLL